MTEKIKVFRHNSICIDDEGRAVYVDPFEMDETPHDAAFILVTHDHYDHFIMRVCDAEIAAEVLEMM